MNIYPKKELKISLKLNSISERPTILESNSFFDRVPLFYAHIFLIDKDLPQKLNLPKWFELCHFLCHIKYLLETRKIATSLFCKSHIFPCFR